MRLLRYLAFPKNAFREAYRNVVHNTTWRPYFGSDVIIFEDRQILDIMAVKLNRFFQRDMIKFHAGLSFQLVKPFRI